MTRRLAWELEWGPRKAELEVLAAAGMTGSRPPSLQGIEGWWQAFLALATCRPGGMGSSGPIPWTAIETYARRHDYEGEEFEDLLHYVTALDRFWLEEAERRESESEA